MPEPSNYYLGKDNGYPTVNERPKASSSNYGDKFTVYRYDKTTGKFQERTDTCARRGYGDYYYYWDEGTWEDIDAPQAYVDAYNAWVAENAEDILKYQQYLEAKERYDAYNTAKTAIENSGNAAESHYNTIRYLEFEVTNADGLTATFRVMQYPVIYITNQQGWYSYRDDFINSKNKVVTYILWKNNDNSTNNYTRCSYDSDNEKWNYYTGNNSRSLFCSKYVYSTSTSGSNQGKSRIDYYYWDYGSNSVSTGHTDVWSENVTDNARMYHVQVTATSGEYIVGRPRFIDENGNPTSNVENGYTEDSAENAKLVSPSFMIASQLGATQSPGIKDEYMPVAADHCRQYVEVAADGTEYHDWRLPTAAEIDIIIKLQNNSQAMDEVLSGRSYWSASGIKNTGLGADNETGRIRCVRDAY